MTNPLKYTCLFGGGAIRGMAYIGTIRALEELGIEYDIIGGSSVGSVMAALIASGYKSYELENLFMKVNFDLFKDILLSLNILLQHYYQNHQCLQIFEIILLHLVIQNHKV